MEKNIKDYLHLYLGCEFEYASAMGSTTEVLSPFWLKEILGGLINISLIQLILRPLSDMNAEESGVKHEIVSGKYNDVFAVAELTRYLLSKGFDLFGLIEAGLAIDKTTLK